MRVFVFEECSQRNYGMSQLPDVISFLLDSSADVSSAREVRIFFIPFSSFVGVGVGKFLFRLFCNSETIWTSQFFRLQEEGKH